ncbi:ankyrin repeat domain-containing protein [Psychrobacter piscatorii]|uniref:ankyrin repeat domain-containing protein n=1 Tax=Psychrobacter piscatorii TaxID=554343 RepID=UPI001917F2B7|nr:ankyrin repeat domain-containing protein [Psychrobacter piscatorii]
MTNEYYPSTPYFLPAEIVRAIARAIDSKNDNASLDIKCKDLYLSRSELDALIEEHIYKPIAKLKLKKSIENEIKALVAQVFDNYLQVVANYSLGEWTRDDTGAWIIEVFFCPSMMKAIHLLGKRTKPFQKSDYLELIVAESSGIDIALNIIEKKVEGWQEFYRKLAKTEKDKITSWRRGESLPSFYSLYNLCNSYNKDTSKNIHLFLIAARAIDYFKITYGSNALMQYVNKPELLEDFIDYFKYKICDLLDRNSQYAAYSNQTEKPVPQMSSIISMYLVTILREFADGNLKQSKETFVKAFDLSLYRSGHMCKKVIEVGLVIASWQETPDMNLISKLKSVQNLYGYTLPTIVTEDAKRKKENLVEDWEINMWRSNAQRVFNDFKVELPEKYTVYSSVLPVYLGAKELELDLKKPNKKVKLNDNSKLHRDKNKKKQVTTQLIWNTLLEDLDAVHKLLQAGADINILSDNNESALLIALQYMNLTELHEPDDSFYQALKDLSYTPKTINAMTSKKHLLPLLSAVQTGRLEIVEHIVNLGADVNQKGGGSHLDALTMCISLIGTIKNSKLPLNQFNMIAKMAKDPKVVIERMSDFEFSTFIRDTQGNFGVNRQQVKRYLAQSRESSDAMAILKDVSKFFQEKIQANYELFNLSEMLKIAKLLIDRGANPSARYDWHGIDGYTPFLLACEINEAELVSYMLDNATVYSKYDIINTAYRDRRDGQAVGYERVCKYFKADDVLEVIDRHFTLESSDKVN